ncbi:MAG: cupin domain-containing protein [Deltaproteobacteria bacterium]|nr:cupin domain-containing protein [Deltaproteobacteria bacterium]
MEHVVRKGNLFERLPQSPEAEEFVDLVKAGGVRIERIVSMGHASPPGFWYDQEAAEWVVLLSGSAGLRFFGREDVLPLSPGDWVEIPAHCKHRVEWTGGDEPAVWLAVHYPG